MRRRLAGMVQKSSGFWVSARTEDHQGGGRSTRAGPGGSDKPAPWLGGLLLISLLFMLNVTLIFTGTPGMDLPHSDGCYVKAYPAETTEAFCDGHVSAFAFLGGVPQSIVYDNTTLAVARILGDGRRRRTRVFTELQSHYLFEDRFGRPGKGNDKGKVEGLVGYVRRNFLVPIPSFESFDALNAHLEQHCVRRFDDRLRGHNETIGERLERDLKALRPLPAVPYDASDKHATRVSSLSLVRYRTNDYSVPVAYGHRDVLVRGYVHEVVISCGAEVIARFGGETGRRRRLGKDGHGLGAGRDAIAGAVLGADPEGVSDVLGQASEGMGDGARIAPGDGGPRAVVLSELVTGDVQRVGTRHPRQLHLADAGVSGGKAFGFDRGRRRLRRSRGLLAGPIALPSRVHGADLEGVRRAVGQAGHDMEGGPGSAPGDCLQNVEDVGALLLPVLVPGYGEICGASPAKPHLFVARDGGE